MNDVIEPPPESPEEKRRKSAGEIVFDRTVYTGIGFGVNEASSLWITDQFTHGKNLLAAAPEPLQKAGKWFSKEGYERLSEMLVSKFNIKDRLGKTGNLITAREHASNMLLMGALFVAGSLLVWPMKKLEDNRSYWVKKSNHLVDRLRGDQLSEEQLAARDADVEKAVACTPKQSWPTLLMGRGIAMFSSWATGTFLVGADRNKRLMQGMEHGAVGVVEGANIVVGGNAGSPLARLAKNETFRRYSGLAAVETYSCAMSSIVLEIASKFLASGKPLVHDPEACAAAAPAARDDEADSPQFAAKIRQQKDASATQPTLAL